MATIFISYTSVDKAWADWIGWVLEHEGGHTVRKHDWEIEAGVIMKWMEEAHDASTCLLAVTSPTYLSKAYSTMERYGAMHTDPIGEKGFFRIALVEKTDLPNLMAIYKRIELHGKDIATAKAELLGYFVPPVKPMSEPTFPGAPAAAAPPPPYPPTLPSAPVTPPPTITHPIFDVDHLPDLAYIELRGRDKELALLDTAWASEGVNVLSLVAWGGAGKTAVVTEWLRKRREAGDAEVVLGWSFYSQGSHQRTTSADGFLVWAARRLDLDTERKTPDQLAEAVAAELGRRCILLVLDGLEPLQEGLGPQMGYLRDPALRILLRRAAELPRRANAGLVLVTTRVAVANLDVARFRDTVWTRPLDRLSDEAGAALLADRGVKGRKTDLEAAAHDFGGHALALTLLAGFLVRRHGGDVTRRDHVRAMVTDGRTTEERVHGHAKRVMESIEAEWLETVPLARAILYAVGLFDRPANAGCLAALRTAPVPSGLAAYADADDDAIADTIFDLRKLGLLAEADPSAPGSLDAHPLVREWFGNRFAEIDAEGWKNAHGRLFDHLRETTKEDPDFPTLEQLQPLFQAIPHGCRAERHQEALNKVYMDRICLRDATGRIIFHASSRLGAVSTDLAAMARFFERPFDLPHPSLTLLDQNWVLASATVTLGELGRFAEALPGLQAAEDAYVEQQNNLSATAASNLAESEAALGSLVVAEASSRRAIERADGAADLFSRIAFRTRAAQIVADRGDRGTARRLFDEAATLQKEWQPEYPSLYSLQGWLFSDFNLSDGAYAAVSDHATYALEVAVACNWLVDIGLDLSSLARAGLGRLLSDDLDADQRPHDALTEAHRHAGLALATLRQANDLKFLPQGHFALARIARACGDWLGATRELDEIEDFARPSGMRLVLCDLALERCRLALAQIERFAPLKPHVSWAVAPSPDRPEPELRAEAEAALAEARAVVETCGYHRRDVEVAELAEVLAGTHRYADLPPRV